jgi:hypothetical protein
MLWRRKSKGSIDIKTFQATHRDTTGTTSRPSPTKRQQADRRTSSVGSGRRRRWQRRTVTTTTALSPFRRPEMAGTIEKAEVGPFAAVVAGSTERRRSSSAVATVNSSSIKCRR